MSSFEFLEGSKLDKVLDAKTGLELDACSLIGSDDNAIRLRTRIQQHLTLSDPLYTCPDCNKPVSLRSNVGKTGQYFAHRDVEGNCPKLQEKGYSQAQIRAMNYDGRKESPAHKETKRFLEECLIADPSFSKVLVEKRLSDGDTKKYRQPDVRATYHGPQGDLVVAFEVQLSSTFLTEIVERREFYRSQGVLLIWVFRNFVRHDPKLTQLDIFYPNNLNAFVVNKMTHGSSIDNEQLYLECHWAEPFIVGSGLGKVIHSDMVSFQNLTLDQKKQQAYLFDYGKHERTVKEELDQRTLQKEVASFIEYCIGEKDKRYDDEAVLRFSQVCKNINIQFPARPGRIIALVKSIKSVEAGEPVGYNFERLVQCANNIAQSHRPLFLYFLAACAAFEREAALEEQDRKQKWKYKKQEIRRELAVKRDIGVVYDDKWVKLVILLFPRIESNLQELVVKTKKFISA